MYEKTDLHISVEEKLGTEISKSLFFENHEDALQFGVQEVNIKVIE